ncbi:adenylate kinase [Pseudofrankia inefficax]|uniref:Adenylate kinase n=1 Tax=Pseudofrankia inefficax (strain DSM 45817 / CECT 9037 / DDB 130130 / EuI1c) TaxID=298654 RepID=E3J304_PSEI1|nr:adenylate kinase [Pseudofrankia inefficax]
MRGSVHSVRVVLLGPPGSGKGTQAARISSRHGIPAISTGRLLDAEIAAGSPLGRRAEEFVRSGELVPDELVLDLVADRLFGSSAAAVLDHEPVAALAASTPVAAAVPLSALAGPGAYAPVPVAADVCRGFLLDGFPRTVAQAEAFDARFGAALEAYRETTQELRLPPVDCAGTARAVDVVLDLDVDESTVLRRISHRSSTEDRLDDNEETAKRRLKVFAERTAPLRAYYARAGLLRTIDGSGTPDDVAARIESVLASLA